VQFAPIETVRELIVLQNENIAAISRAYVNFKKLAKTQITAYKLRNRLVFLKDTWDKFQNFHARLLLMATEDDHTEKKVHSKKFFFIQINTAITGCQLNISKSEKNVMSV